MNTHALDRDRRSWRTTLGCAVVVGLIGCVLGVQYAKTQPISYRATTALSVQPDDLVLGQTALGQTGPNQDAATFIQSQLIVLTGGQLADLVRQQVSLPAAPALVANQIGQSYSVRLTAQGDTAQLAAATAAAAVLQYVKLRTAGFLAAIKVSSDAVNARLATVQASLVSAELAAPALDGLTPSVVALQTEFQRLLSVRDGLSLAVPKAGSLVTTLAPASAVGAPLSRRSELAVGGGLLGLILGGLLARVRRRAAHRVRTVTDVAALGLPALVPPMPRRSGWRAWPAWRPDSARLAAGLLASRLAGLAGNGRPIAVAGTAPGVGTSFVATSIAAAIAEHGPVLVIGPGPAAAPNPRATVPADARELIAGADETAVPGVWVLSVPADQYAGVARSNPQALINDLAQRAIQAGWLVVIDAGSADEGATALDWVAASAVCALVTGRSRSEDVLPAAVLLATAGVPFAGVILNDVPAAPFRRLPRPSAERAALPRSSQVGLARLSTLAKR